jgi:DNA-binding NarL/FixJ family response regulator
MKATIFFANALSRERALTEAETDMLCRSMQREPTGRRLWTQADDREIARLARKGLKAPQIAERVGRTAMAVRLRLHRLGKRDGG